MCNHPFNGNAYKNVEKKLKETSETLMVLHKLESTFKAFKYFDEFNWEINLDDGSFNLYTENKPKHIKKYFFQYSMKSIFVTFSGHRRGRKRSSLIKLWLSDYFIYDQDYNEDEAKTRFLDNFCTILIQRQFRRYVMWKQTLEPGGLNYLNAAKRFKMASGSVF